MKKKKKKQYYLFKKNSRLKTLYVPFKTTLQLFSFKTKDLSHTHTT